MMSSSWQFAVSSVSSAASARRRAPTSTAGLLLALILLAAPPVHALDPPGPLVQVSGASPFLLCTADFPNLQTGTNFPASEVEPWVVVNPLDPDHIVGTWQQDRWSNGAARGAGVAVSFDGGLTWTGGTLPHLTLCTGGVYFRASDPWLDFAADGRLYHMSLVTGPGGRNGMVAQTSEDGGLTWAPPVVMVDETAFVHDKNTLTADPFDANVAYTVWDRIDFLNFLVPTIFTRTTDGGATWEPIRPIHNPGSFAQTIGNQIVVGPSGTLYNFFNEIFFLTVPPFFQQNLALKVSFDQGDTWHPGGTDGPSLPVAPMIRGLGSVDPDGNGVPVREGSLLFDVAVDATTGALYAVWQDFRFSGGAFTSVAFSQSTDGGATWTPPVKINRTPTDIPPLHQQAFVPSVAVNDKGRIAVTYYDFRNNDDGPAALTDYWAITCQPENPARTFDCSDPAHWSGEIRLTDHSFDLTRAPLTTTGLFLGDYQGLEASVNEFLAFFSATHGTDPASVFIRRFDEGPEADEVENATAPAIQFGFGASGASTPLPGLDRPADEPFTVKNQ